MEILLKNYPDDGFGDLLQLLQIIASNGALIQVHVIVETFSNRWSITQMSSTETFAGLSQTKMCSDNVCLEAFDLHVCGTVPEHLLRFIIIFELEEFNFRISFQGTIQIPKLKQELEPQMSRNKPLR